MINSEIKSMLRYTFQTLGCVSCLCLSVPFYVSNDLAPFFTTPSSACLSPYSMATPLLLIESD